MLGAGPLDMSQRIFKNYPSPSTEKPIMSEANPSSSPDPSTPPPATPGTPAPTVELQSDAAAPDSASSSELPPTLAAGLAAVFPLIGGIVFFILEKKNAFVRFYALQSIYFGIAGIVFSVVLSIITMIPFIGWIVGPLLWVLVMLGMTVLWLINLFKAFSGVEWEMPIVGKMVRDQLARTP